MAYQGLPGWIRRRKVGTSKYEMIYNGQPVAIVVLEGRYGADDYPWGWYTTDIGERLVGIQTGNGDSLGRCIEDIYWKHFKALEDLKGQLSTDDGFAPGTAWNERLSDD